MRGPRQRVGVLALVGALGAGGLGAVVAASAGADSPGSPTQAGGAAGLPAVVATRLSQSVVAGRGQLGVEDDTLATGDQVMTYSLNGRQLVKLRDRASCHGRSRGMAQITPLGSGGYEVSGVTALGARGLVITLRDATVVNAPLAAPGPGEYPFFDVVVSSPPVSFDTTGVAVPSGCAAPIGGPDS